MFLKLRNHFLNQEFSLFSVGVFVARSVLGYVLIINSPIGTIIPLEGLGLAPQVYQFIKSLWDTGYMMHLVKVIELVTGICLLLNVCVPLAMIILMPVLINIVGLGFSMMPGGLSRSIPMLIAALAVIYQNRKAYTGLLTP
ncbi:MAG: hypothetical protein KA715_09775 [Xanthomonadaceae bacterium]|nr:hypothetical protein [Xanthomonadaceae bacterium]